MLHQLFPPAMSDRGRLGPLTLSLTPSATNALLLLARILIGYIFVLSGWGKLMGLTGFAGYLAGHGVPASTAFAVVGAAAEFFGGLALVLGFALRYTVLLMIGFTVVATGIAHRFWELEGATRQAQSISFNKNIEIIGGLVALFVAGPGQFSLDARLSRRRA